jgi:hypothetical protein
VKNGDIIYHISIGVVLLDLEEKDLPGVAYRVVEQMVVDELIEPEEKPTVMRALLLRHRHVNEHDRFRFGMKRTFSSYTSLQVSYLGYSSTLMGHIPRYLMYWQLVHNVEHQCLLGYYILGKNFQIQNFL